jgi:hypothetical protein
MPANPPGIFGHGLDVYQSDVPLFFWRGKGQTGVGPHNAFLQIYFEMGIAGLTSFLLLVAAIAFKLILQIQGRLCRLIRDVDDARRIYGCFLRR